MTDRTWIDSGGYPHSDAMRVQERYHRTGMNVLELTVTIDDPKVYTRPFQSRDRLPLKRLPDWYRFPGTGVRRIRSQGIQGRRRRPDQDAVIPRRSDERGTWRSDGDIGHPVAMDAGAAEPRADHFRAPRIPPRDGAGAGLFRAPGSMFHPPPCSARSSCCVFPAAC
jgi:hypothetical protein